LVRFSGRCREKINNLERDNKFLAAILARKEVQFKNAHEFIEVLKTEKRELEYLAVGDVFSEELGLYEDS